MIWDKISERLQSSRAIPESFPISLLLLHFEVHGWTSSRQSGNHRKMDYTLQYYVMILGE